MNKLLLLLILLLACNNEDKSILGECYFKYQMVDMDREHNLHFLPEIKLSKEHLDSIEYLLKKMHKPYIRDLNGDIYSKCDSLSMIEIFDLESSLYTNSIKPGFLNFENFKQKNKG